MWRFENTIIFWWVSVIAAFTCAGGVGVRDCVCAVVWGKEWGKGHQWQHPAVSYFSQNQSKNYSGKLMEFPIQSKYISMSGALCNWPHSTSRVVNRRCAQHTTLYQLTLLHITLLSHTFLKPHTPNTILIQYLAYKVFL